MRNLLLSLLVGLSALAGNANAEIIFSLSPATSSIIRGEKADFNVFINSTTSVTVGGYSVNVVAGPGDGTAGSFSSGTFSFLVGDPQQSWDVTTTPGQAFSTADTSNFGGTGTGAALTANTSQLLGTLTLDTTGAQLGNYQMSFSAPDLSAIQVNGNFFSGGVNGASSTGPINFSITAVPEPTSLALIGLVVGGIASRKVLRRRCKADKSLIA